MEAGTLRPAMEVRMESRNSRGFGSAVGAPGPLPGVSEMFPMTALESLGKMTKVVVVGGVVMPDLEPRKTKHQCMIVD